MTAINSIASTASTTSTYTAKGFSGLVSGMDTESVVESMTADIQAKIDKVKQEQQKNTWKQDAYRTVIASLINFQDKYLSYSSPSTNLLSSAIYNCSKKTSQGANASKISVTSTSNSNNAAYQVSSVKSLATKARYTGACGLGSNEISTGSIDFGDRTVNVASGKEMEITYNNVRYSVTIPENGTTDSDFQALSMQSALNEALRSVTLEDGSGTLAEKIGFDLSGDTLSLKSLYSGSTNTFSISGGDSEALAALGFSAGQSGSAASAIEGTSAVDVVQTKAFSLEGKKLTFDLDGLSKTISFDASDSAAITGAGDDAAKLQKLAETINSKLAAAFGANKIVADVTDGTKIGFTVTDSTSILKISSTSSDTIGSGSIFGMESGITNRLNTHKTLAELGFTPTSKDASDPDNTSLYAYKITVNGKEFEFKGDDEISTVLNKINNDETAGINITYLSTTNKFSIAADQSGSTGKIDIQDSTGGGNLAAALFGDTAAISAGTVKGTDLVMTIKYDGDASETTLTRSSNSVTVDGISFNVEGTFGWTGAEGSEVRDTTAEAVTFKNTSDTDNAVSVIKQMVEDYNKIIDSVNELVTTKSRESTKNGQNVYEPLTDAQKKDMTSEEIEAWETKAKAGILFGDSTLTQLASSLRFAFSSKVGDLGFGKDIGITTASSYSGNGKLSIDEDKLREALTNNPEKVKEMFVSSAEDAPNSAMSNLSGGFAVRMQNLFESYAKSTGSYKGKLVQLAGLQNNTTTSNNYIARQQKILDNKLETLQTLLATRQDRYQSQFTKLEQYISQMNAQSSWLSSSMS